MRQLVCCLFVVLAGRAMAQTAPAPTPSPVPVGKTIVGQILSVDLETRTVVVRESVRTTRVKGQAVKRETVSITLEPSTPIQRGKKLSTVSDLKPKDMVVARYVVTPSGARAISLRAAELVAQAPTPSATPGENASASGGDNNGQH